MAIISRIEMNPNLYLKNPESSDLGQNIIKKSVALIAEIGFEQFTFKKLANQIGTTEAGIYRYFENKHRLLTYLTTWFWNWLDFQVVFETNNINDPREKIEIIIQLLTDKIEDEHINKLHQVVIDEGDKTYFTKHVNEDNQAQFFKPYKDLCNRIAKIILDFNADYRFPHSLATMIIETAHHQYFFQHHLPSLTDFGNNKNQDSLKQFLEEMVFKTLN